MFLQIKASVDGKNFNIDPEIGVDRKFSSHLMIPMTTTATSHSMECTAIRLPRFPTVRCSALPNLPPRHFRTSYRRLSGTRVE
ncbi:hypothetical protein L1987_43979 [Smallanthus sonchifolius]|uniref:Uncharacterized protein n=1 Tax=Smallanthus sonchifolius TaxID=185202 RepID=A0ACB9GQ70_9ASTR|nr:hypothetical protein L1987_43979 [Smallanthus sonchifolius]